MPPAAPVTFAPMSFKDNMRGAGFMTLSMFGFAFNDALMKLLAPDTGLYQAIFVRGVMASLLILALAWRFGAFARAPSRADAPWLATRAAAEVGATWCYLTALMNMGLAEVAAIAQTMPLAITLAGALFLGEKVGWRRWTAIAAGFAGVVAILRPGVGAFNPYALLALTGVVFFVVRDLATRRLSAATPSMLVSLLTAVTVTMMGGAGVAALGDGWTPMAGATLGGLAVAAGAVAVGYHFSIGGMRTGDIGFVSPFRYTTLVWATILGLVLFAERPDLYTLVGATLIVGAGLYTFQRERRLMRG